MHRYVTGAVLAAAITILAPGHALAPPASVIFIATQLQAPNIGGDGVWIFPVTVQAADGLYGEFFDVSVSVTNLQSNEGVIKATVAAALAPLVQARYAEVLGLQVPLPVAASDFRFLP